MYHISTEQMEYFLTVANQHSFSEAAKRLYVTQPTVTKWIQRLEKELGLQLFERNSRNVSLTAEGRLLYVRWLAVWNALQDSIDEAHKSYQSEQRNLSIGLRYGYDYTFNNLLSDFQKQYPQITLAVSVIDYRELQERFNNREFDVVVTDSWQKEDLRNAVGDVAPAEPLLLAVAKQDPLASRTVVGAKELRDHRFYAISRSASYNEYQHTVELLDSMQIQGRLAEQENIPSQQAAVRTGLGIAIADQLFFKGNEREMSRIRFENGSLKRARICCWHKNDSKYAVQRFIRMLQHNKFAAQVKD